MMRIVFDPIKETITGRERGRERKVRERESQTLSHLICREHPFWCKLPDKIKEKREEEMLNITENTTQQWSIVIVKCFFFIFVRQSEKWTNVFGVGEWVFVLCCSFDGVLFTHPRKRCTGVDRTPFSDAMAKTSKFAQKIQRKKFQSRFSTLNFHRQT